MSLQVELNREILCAETYRQFLRSVFELNKRFRKHYSYGTFANAAGFSSRSFLGDVIRGRKALTEKSLPKTIKGLGLKGEAAKFLSLLVRAEEWDKGEKAQIQNSIVKLKGRVKSKLNSAEKKLDGEFRKHRYWREIYSALGGTDGASLADIVKRTGIKEIECLDSLREMVDAKVARRDDKDVFFPIDDHLILSLLNSGEETFLKFYCDSLKKVESAAKRQVKTDQALFMGSVLLVDSHDLPALKEELRETISRFVDGCEKSKGDKIARITVGFGCF